jgi:hypothetical protein
MDIETLQEVWMKLDTSRIWMREEQRQAMDDKDHRYARSIMEQLDGVDHCMGLIHEMMAECMKGKNRAS